MVLARFLPRDEQFFKLFRDAAANAAETARLLIEVFEQHAEVERKVRRMRDLEHQGDEITHEIFNALNRTFVTPLDREDIKELASELDNFVDDIEEVAKRLSLYRMPESTESARLLARIVGEQAAILTEAVPLLENASKQGAALRRHAVEVNRLENEADDVLNQALATQFDGATDIPTLVLAIRWGEIYQLLEDATDRGEDVANILEGIVLKHA